MTPPEGYAVEEVEGSLRHSTPKVDGSRALGIDEWCRIYVTDLLLCSVCNSCRESHVTCKVDELG